jgi:ATP-dependent DNA helicase DinG
MGRLLRSQRHRGVLVILDGRLLTKSYGQAFLDALPGSDIETPALSGLGRAVAQWLGLGPVEGAGSDR